MPWIVLTFFHPLWSLLSNFRKALADQSLVIMETGLASPCIDLRYFDNMFLPKGIFIDICDVSDIY